MEMHLLCASKEHFTYSNASDGQSTLPKSFQFKLHLAITGFFKETLFESYTFQDILMLRHHLDAKYKLLILN